MGFYHVIILGNVKRVGQTTSYFVPFMAIFYIVAGLVLIIRDAAPELLLQFRGGFL